jgi:hypothetical protein
MPPSLEQGHDAPEEQRVPTCVRADEDMHEPAVEVEHEPVRNVQDDQQQNGQRQPRPAEPQAGQQDGRPEDVELLFDCE